jgi:hypothetical protein
LHERRRNFATRGLEWHSAESSESRRKAAQRALEQLEDEGFAETVRGRGKAIGVKLTNLGEQSARALVALPNIDVAHEALREFACWHHAGHGVTWWTGRLWIPEVAYTGFDWGHPANDRRGENLLGTLQQMLFPALARGWLDSLSSTQGHLWYSFTPDGLAAAADPAAGILLPALPPADDDLGKLYDQHFAAELERIDKATPSSVGELGMIPLPVSHGMTEPHRPPTEGTADA